MAGKKAKPNSRDSPEPKYAWRMKKQDGKIFSSPPHPFDPSMLERFEIKQSPSKGLGAFATKPIKAGTTIFEEEPLFVIKGPSGLTTEKNVQRAYYDLSPADKKLFDQCRHDPTHKPGCKCKLGTFHANQFTTGDMLNQTASMFPIGSKLNHSCSPNSFSLTPLDKTATHHTFKALRDIAAGEEIGFCYSHNFNHLTSTERQQFLNQDGDAISSFKCRCKRCTAPPKKRMVSDMRRRMLRYLHFWLRQDDIDDPPNDLNAPPRDPELVKNGVYSLLYAILLEVEGILSGNDAYMAYALTAWHVLNVAYHNGKSERVYSSVVRDMRLWMKAEANARIQYGEENLMAEAGDMFEAISLQMKFVGDDGVIRWGGLMKLKEKFLKERNFGVFSTYPPGSDLKPPGMSKAPKCPTM